MAYSSSGEHLIAAFENVYGDSGAGVFGARGNLVAFFVDDSRLAWMPHGNGLLRVYQRRGIDIEQLGFPEMISLSQLALPGRPAGVAGYIPSVDPTGRHAAVLMYSGQSEEGYVLLGLDPLRLLQEVPYRNGESSLDPMAFSPSGELVAFILSEQPVWWTTSDDADWDTPAEGGVVEWATLHLHRIGEADARRISLRTHVAPGWVPPELPYHRGLRFLDETTLQVSLPWGQEPVRLGLTSSRVIDLPSASRCRPRQD